MSDRDKTEGFLGIMPSRVRTPGVLRSVLTYSGPERRSSPRIPHVYTPEENAAFEERIKAVMADPFYRLED